LKASGERGDRTTYFIGLLFSILLAHMILIRVSIQHFYVPLVISRKTTLCFANGCPKTEVGLVRSALIECSCDDIGTKRAHGNHDDDLPL
jgi:hypothetical protein